MSGLRDAIWALIAIPASLIYQFIQTIIDFVFAPRVPPPSTKLGRGKIAIIGAGLTGISSATHCVGNGFDVTIFEAGDESSLGGIWAKVNSTSGLQIHSLMYRFHPSVCWTKGYPKSEEIVGEVRKIWTRYKLQDKTKFNTRVEKIYKDEKGRWIVNDPSNGRFNGVMVATGTCGAPKMPKIKGQEKFKGEIFHSSELDGKDAKDKTILIIGGGASAVEALEFAAAAGAKKTYVLARSEKWIIPRNPVIDVLLSLNIFGGQTPLSIIPETLLRVFFYRDLAYISPPRNSGKGIFTETPMVNTDVLDQIRKGNAEWLRGDPLNFTEDGINFNRRKQGVLKGGDGEQEVIKGDICILATGYERPSMKFLPDDCFQQYYEPPNWYLQVFPPKYTDICANNCTYVNAIGTVGNYHIGIYARFLLMFMVDPLARPTEDVAKTWIDFTRWVKRFAPTGAFDFFTYAELMYWFVFIILINPFRWKWSLFVLTGLGAALPRLVVEEEQKLRDGFEKAKMEERP